MALSGDRVLWIHQDTLVGTLDHHAGDFNTRQQHCMPHNSVALMQRVKTSFGGGSSWNLTHYIRGECTARWCMPSSMAACSADPEALGATANGFFAPKNTSRWYWTENGLVVGTRLFIFAQTLSRPCAIGCNQVGIAFIEVINPRDTPLQWRYTTDDISDTWWDTWITYPTALTVTNETAYFLGRGKSSNTSHDDIAVLARIPTAALLLADRQMRWGQLQFWTSPGVWAHVPTSSLGGVNSLHLEPLFNDPPPETSLYYMTAIHRWIQLVIPFRSTKLSLRVAPELTGPWSNEVVVYNISKPWVSTLHIPLCCKRIGLAKTDARMMGVRY
jgi:hypothetical protein